MNVVQEDKTGKSKQGGNKGQCVSCCHHTSRENGECRGAVIERPTCGASSCSWIVLCVYINSSLLPIVIFVSGCVFSSYFWAINKNLLNKLARESCVRAPFEVFERDQQDKSVGRMR